MNGANQKIVNVERNFGQGVGGRVPKSMIAKLHGLTAEQVAKRTGLSLRRARRLLEATSA